VAAQRKAAVEKTQREEEAAHLDKWAINTQGFSDFNQSTTQQHQVFVFCKGITLLINKCWFFDEYNDI